MKIDNIMESENHLAKMKDIYWDVTIDNEAGSEDASRCSLYLFTDVLRK